MLVRDTFPHSLVQFPTIQHLLRFHLQPSTHQGNDQRSQDFQFYHEILRNELVTTCIVRYTFSNCSRVGVIREPHSTLPGVSSDPLLWLLFPQPVEKFSWASVPESKIKHNRKTTARMPSRILRYLRETQYSKEISWSNTIWMNKKILQLLTCLESRMRWFV